MGKMKYNPLTGLMDTVDECTTTQDIPIDAEAPLSSAVDRSFWPSSWVKNGTVCIPAGETLDSILMELFARTENGEVTWFFTRDEKQVSSNIDYTPIVECHGGKWSLVSDKSVSIIPLLRAELSHNYGYFLSADGKWCNAPLTVDISGICSKGLVYKKNGSTVTRDPGNWRDYTFDDDFGMAYAISEEATLHPVIPAGEYHTPVYASTNKKRIALDVSAKLNFDNPYEFTARTIVSTRKIHGSYYYFAGVFDLEDLEGGILDINSLENWKIKDFVHKLVVNDSGDTAVCYPDIIDFTMQVPAGQIAIVAIPADTHAVNHIEGLGGAWGRRFASYTCPDGYTPAYIANIYSNNTSNTIELPVQIIKL